MSDSLTTQADEVLLQQFDSRGDDAFDVLVARYKDRLIDLAGCLLGDADTAWPIVQKVFVNLYFGPRAGARVRKTSVWLYTQTLRGIRGYQRRQRWVSAAKSFLSRSGGVAETSEAGPTWSLKPVGVPDEERLRLGLSILPDPLKEVYVLCELQGLSVEEVGSILRVPTAEVQAHIEKARVVFREIISQREEEQ